MYAREAGLNAPSDFPKIQVPVLVLYGLSDSTLSSEMFSGTGQWVARDYTLLTVRGAGHFVQQDAAEFVSRSMRAWLLR